MFLEHLQKMLGVDLSKGGSILCATGMIDPRTIEKLKKDAQDIGKPSWWLSWYDQVFDSGYWFHLHISAHFQDTNVTYYRALDLTNEERTKGYEPGDSCSEMIS